MQLLVRAWELHTLEVTGLEAFAHIKAKTHVASLEGHTIEDKVVLLAGSPLPDEAILGQCGVEALATLEMVGRMLGGDWGYRGLTAATGLFTILRLIYLPFTVSNIFCFNLQYLKTG